MPVKTVCKKAAAPPAMDEGVRKELMELVRNNEHLFPEHSTRLLLLKYPPSRRAGILAKLREMDGLGDLEVPDDDTE